MQHASRFLPSGLLSEAANVARISSMLRSVLPGNLASHVWFAGIKERTACLVTDNGCWVATLRFQQQMLLDKINALSDQPTCTQVRIQVVPEGFSPFPRFESPKNTQPKDKTG